MPRSEEEELDVEGPAVNVLDGEEQPRRFASEQLEPALGVLDLTAADHDLDKGVEAPHKELPQRGTLGHGTAGLLRRGLEVGTRADSDAKRAHAALRRAGGDLLDLLQLTHEGGQVRSLGCSVRVGHEDVAPPSPNGALADGPTLAVIAEQPENAELFRAVLRDVGFVDEACGLVLAAVIHDQDFPGEAVVALLVFCLLLLLLEEGEHLLHHRHDPLLLVVGRDNNADSNGGLVKYGGKLLHAAKGKMLQSDD